MQLSPRVLMSKSNNRLSCSLCHRTKTEAITMLMRQSLSCLPRQIKRMNAFSQSIACFLLRILKEKEKTQSKFRIRTKNMTDYIQKKKSRTSQELLSSWTIKQTVFWQHLGEVGTLV